MSSRNYVCPTFSRVLAAGGLAQHQSEIQRGRLAKFSPLSGCGAAGADASRSRGAQTTLPASRDGGGCGERTPGNEAATLSLSATS